MADVVAVLRRWADEIEAKRGRWPAWPREKPSRQWVTAAFLELVNQADPSLHWLRVWLEEVIAGVDDDD